MVTSCIVRQFYCKREARTERRLIEGNFLSAHAHPSNKLSLFLDNSISVLWESGILERFYLEQVPWKNVAKCIQRPINRPTKSPISLYDLSSAFIVLGVGYLLALFAFLIELWMK